MSFYKLDQIADVIMGQSPSGQSYNKSFKGIPLLNGAADFNENSITPKQFTSEPTKICQKDDVLMCIRATIGNLTISDGSYCLGRGVAAIRLKNGKYDRRFLIHSINQNLRYLKSKASGTTIVGLKREDITELKIPKINFAAQQKIATILDKADELRRKDQQLLLKYDELLQSIFYQMFGDPLTNKKGWPTMNGQVYAKKLSVGVVIQPASHYVEKGVIALRSLNIRPNEIILENLVYFSEEAHLGMLSKSIIRENDVVIVRTGATGTAAVVPKKLDNCNCIDLIIVRPNLDVVNPNYIAYFFNSPWGKNLVTGKEVGGIQKHFNIGALKSLNVPIPPIALQNEFGVIAENIEHQIQSTRCQLEKSESLFKSLLQKAFKGDLVK